MDIIKDPFKYQREVSFFLRLHRHLPDGFCGGSPLSSCKYRPDGIAINSANDYVEELQKDPEFVRKEKEVEEAVRKKWKRETWRYKAGYGIKMFVQKMKRSVKEKE